jgi:hypothetical protein
MSIEFPQHQHQVQHQQLKPALHGIGYAVIAIKYACAGLRHDRAIEGVNSIVVDASPKRR